MRAFVIRPFGIRDGVDFNAVQLQLIDPALAALGIEGVTSAALLEGGNIREDIFQLLLGADLVIADVTLHNATVFYELGVRQALRRRSTLLIRNQRPGSVASEVPFDMRTDRYVEYDVAQPDKSLAALQEALRVILASEVTDSPVFQMLPVLEEQHSSRFLPVPASFATDVQIAERSRQVSILGLLASEVRMHNVAWASEGLRLVGRAQFNLKAYRAAKTTFEELWRLLPTDVETNQRLATIYQRLGDLDASDQALRRVIEDKRTAPRDRAEALSLQARNIKDRWRASWGESIGNDAARRALLSPDLFRAYEAYRRAFHNDLDSYYPGLNAMSLLTLAIELAKRLPDDWESRFETESDAARELEVLESQRQKVSGAVGMSLDAARETVRESGEDRWLEISAADYLFLTSSKPKRVAFAYQRSLEGAPDFYWDAARGQLELFQRLGVLPEKTEAALAVFPQQTALSLSAGPAPRPRAVIFISQNVPPNVSIGGVHDAIAQAIREIQQQSAGEIIGVASAASGGDLLFHDVCAKLDIESRVYLPVPVDQFRAGWVSPGGPQWEDKFDALLAAKPTYETLFNSGGWQIWLWADPEYGPADRANAWLVQAALALDPLDLTILTVSTVLQGDSPEQRRLQTLAARYGARLVTISLAELRTAATS